MPITQVLLNSPKIQGFKFTLLLISFNPSSHSPICLSLDPNLISEHLVQGNGSCQRRPEFTADPHPSCVLWKMILFLNTRLSLIPSDMVPACFCVFWLSQHFSSPLQILRCKMRRHESSGPLPCHDFLFSLGEINGPCCSPPEALFIGALLFSNSLFLSLSGPVVPRSHVRTDYTPARHCSLPHSGFALSGGAPHYYSAEDFKHFPNSV